VIRSDDPHFGVLDVIEVDGDIVWYRTVTMLVGVTSWRHMMKRSIERMKDNSERVQPFSSVSVRRP